jgi:UDP-N-acetylmuramate: L-alanyl-gamma-D-glutamyl-meso-diaminopimelate ligase
LTVDIEKNSVLPRTKVTNTFITMTAKPSSHIHLLGICGTGMAALAGILKELGHRVSGSDEHVYPPMSTFLMGLGIPIQNSMSPGFPSPKP